MNKLYTAQEIADKLQIKKTTVYELIKRGELYSSKVGKQLRISEQQLKQYLERSGSGNNMPDQKAVSSSTPNGNLQIPELPPESSLLKRDYLLHSSGLILCGQFSPALELLISQMSIHPQGIPVLQSFMNSYNSLYSLYFKKAHIACASLDLEHIRSLVPGVQLSLLDFIPLQTLPMYLVMETEALSQPGFSALLEIVRSEDFRTILQGQTGYNVTRTGELLSL